MNILRTFAAGKAYAPQGKRAPQGRLMPAQRDEPSAPPQAEDDTLPHAKDGATPHVDIALRAIGRLVPALWAGHEPSLRGGRTDRAAGRVYGSGAQADCRGRRGRRPLHIFFTCPLSLVTLCCVRGMAAVVSGHYGQTRGPEYGPSGTPAPACPCCLLLITPPVRADVDIRLYKPLTTSHSPLSRAKIFPHPPLTRGRGMI